MRARLLAVVAICASGCACGTAPIDDAAALPVPPPVPSAMATATATATARSSTRLVLTGDPAARDRYGYPTATADKVQLQKLFMSQRFAELDAAVRALQEEHEADFTKEYWACDAIEAVMPQRHGFEQRFTAFVEAYPESWVPYAMRGAWAVNIGYDARGSAWAKDTSEAQFDKMHEWFARARADLERALALKDKLVSVDRQLVIIARVGGGDEDAPYRHAISVCPACYHVRVQRILGLQPRWGGSTEAMLAFADAEANAHPENKRLQVLRGYAYDDLASRERDEVKALALIEKALSYGDAGDFYRERALLRRRLGDRAGAIADHRRAWELRPSNEQFPALLARALADDGQYDEAALHLRTALKINPLDSEVRGAVSAVVNIVVKQAELVKADDPERARYFVDIARRFRPSDGRVKRLHAEVPPATTSAATPATTGTPPGTSPGSPPATTPGTLPGTAAPAADAQPDAERVDD